MNCVRAYGVVENHDPVLRGTMIDRRRRVGLEQGPSRLPSTVCCESRCTHWSRVRIGHAVALALLQHVYAVVIAGRLRRPMS